MQSAGVVFGHIGFGGNMTPRWVTIVVFPLSDITLKGYQDAQFRCSDDDNNKGYVKKKYIYKIYEVFRDLVIIILISNC